MNKDKQRIAIATACGWKFNCPWVHWQRATIHPNGTVVETWNLNGRTKEGAASDHIYSLPDYLSDLNAIHDAEKALNTKRIRRVYFEHLCRLNGCNENTGIHDNCVAMAFATAAKRAEAFLKTLSLWEDGE